MWSTVNVLVIFVFLYTFSNAEPAENETYRKEWKFQGNASFKYGRSIATDDNSFIYAACIEDKLPAEMNCNITIDTPTQRWNSSKSHKHTCKLNLTGTQEGDNRFEVTDVVSVEGFANDRVIIVWWERPKDSQFEVQNIRVSIVDMINCTIVHLTFPLDLERHVLLSNVVVYPNSFDVIISNKALCNSSITCRITYDVEGRQIGDPMFFPNNLSIAYTQPVSSNSSDKGFYICGSDMSSWKFRAMYVNATGAKTNLLKVSASDPRDIFWTTSNSHELYGICLMGYKKIHCAQFDTEVSVKMNATINLHSPVDWMAVHNLKEDGILVATGQCNNNKCRSFKIIRIHKSGRQEKPVDAHGLQIKCACVPHEMSVSVVESGDDFCFYFACAQPQDGQNKTMITKSSVKFNAKCIPKNEFKI